MNKCLSCGAQLAKGARFCSVCGAAAPGASPTQMPTQSYNRPTQMPTPGYPPTQMPTQGSPTGTYAPPTDPNRQRNTLLIAGGAVALCLILFFLLKMSGVLGAKKSEVPSAAVLTAPQTKIAEAPVLTAPPVEKPEAPVLAPPKGTPMPADVIAYLRWLKQFEAARRSLEYKGTAAYMKLPAQMTMKMMNALDENNADNPQAASSTTGDIAAEIGGIVQELNVATGRFQEYPPPNPCAPLATAYLSSLKTKVGQLAKMQVAVTEVFKMFDSQGNTNQAAQDMLPQLLQEMQTRSMSREADAADIATNQALNALRAQYVDIPEDIDGNHFDIKQVETTIDPKTMIPPGMGLGL